jgi:hypothetical protein
MNAQPDNQRPVYVVRQSSPETEGAATTAMWLEIIFGIFSLLGVGHVYSGRTALGIALMVGWWVYIGVASFLSTITLGFAACLFVPLFIAVPIISGVQARTYTQRVGGKGRWESVGLVAGGGCLLVILAIVGFVVFVVMAGSLSQYNY